MKRSPLLLAGRHLAVLAAYFGLTLVFTWPLAPEFFSAVPGGGDAWQHLWNLWWMRKALVDLHTDPFYTTYLYYPHGVTLLFHTLVPLESALTIPFQLLGVDLVPLYNGVLVLSFVLAGYGTWLLVRDLTGNGAAAFVAGFAFAFCPYHLGHLLGHMNLASLQWIPLYLWALFRALGAPGAVVGDGPNPPAPFPYREGGVKPNPPAPAAEGGESSRLAAGVSVSAGGADAESATPPSRHGKGAGGLGPARAGLGWAALAGLFLVANAFTDWIYVAFLGVFTAGYLLWRVAVDTRGRAGWAAWPRLIGRLVVLGVVFGVLAGPVLLRTVQAQQGQDWMRFPPRETLVYSSDLVDSFVPPALHPLWSGWALALQRQFPERNTAERAVFLGYVPLLVGVGALVLIRRRAVVFWASAAAGAWLLSLGPELHVLGRSTFTIFGATIPLPYLVLYSLVPGFSVMRVPARFIVLASLALAVLIGYALAALAARSRRNPPSRVSRFPFPGLTRTPLSTRLAYALVAAALALEFLAVPYPMAPPGYHIPFYARIAQEPGNFALLELPLRPMADYMAYQTVHGHPIVYGYLSRQPPDPFVTDTPVLHYLLDATPVDALPLDQVANGAATLRAAGIRYVVVHWWALTAADAATLQAKLSALFPTQPREEDPADAMSVYTLGP